VPEARLDNSGSGLAPAGDAVRRGPATRGPG